MRSREAHPSTVTLGGSGTAGLGCGTAQTPQQGKRGPQPHPNSSQHCWHCCPEQLGHSLPSPSPTSRTLPQATA